MNDVREGILAALAEVESAAWAAAERHGERMLLGGEWVPTAGARWDATPDGDGWAIEAPTLIEDEALCVTCNDSGGNELSAEAAAHIALNDPAAVLAWVDQTRRLLAQVDAAYAMIAQWERSPDRTWISTLAEELRFELESAAAIWPQPSGSGEQGVSGA